MVVLMAKIQITYDNIGSIVNITRLIDEKYDETLPSTIIVDDSVIKQESRDVLKVQNNQVIVDEVKVRERDERLNQSRDEEEMAFLAVQEAFSKIQDPAVVQLFQALLGPVDGLSLKKLYRTLKAQAGDK